MSDHITTEQMRLMANGDPAFRNHDRHDALRSAADLLDDLKTKLTAMTERDAQWNEKWKATVDLMMQAKAEREKLQAFKTFVHARLDAMEVPADPPGKHRDEGCRVGQRLAWLEAEREAVFSDLVEQTKELNEIFGTIRNFLAEECGRADVKNPVGAIMSACKMMRDGRDKLQTLASSVNDIRNSIIGLQTVNWSEHIYPLVAALDAAGIQGLTFPEAREKFLALSMRAVSAEDNCDRLKGALIDICAAVPAHGEGGFFWENHDENGNYLGSTFVDPVQVVQGIQEIAQKAIRP